MVMTDRDDDGGDGDRDRDREEWPRYWRAIRTAVVWLLVVVVIVGGGAFLPRPEGVVPRVAMEFLIGFAVVLVATLLAKRVNAWWEERQA
jgi:hypothetical protein